MNTSQFYYAHNVLGISSFLQPQKIRSTYRLYHSSETETEFLFFCQQLYSSPPLSQGPALQGSNKISINKEKDSSLIQKIAQALRFSNYGIVEILDKQSLHVPYILNNLLTRFCPKGFVIFGPDLASHLNPKGFNFHNSEHSPTSEIENRAKEVTQNHHLNPKGFNFHNSEHSPTSEIENRAKEVTQNHHLNPKGFNFHNSEHSPTSEIENRAKEVTQNHHLNPKGFNFHNSEKNPTLEIKNPQTKYSNNPSVKNLYRQITKTIPINKNQYHSISGCILNKLSDFTAPDLKKVQETKKQAWKILKQVFPR